MQETKNMTIAEFYEYAHGVATATADQLKPIPFEHHYYENPVFTEEDMKSGEYANRERKTAIEPEGCCGFVNLRVDAHTEFAMFIRANKNGKDDGRMISWTVDYNSQSLSRQTNYAIAFMQELARRGDYSEFSARID